MAYGNRITDAVARISKVLDGLSAEKLAVVAENATLSVSDRLMLGDAASRAMLAGKVSADEASTLYAIHRSWDSATVAERVTYMQAIMEAR